ncbi:MAG: family 43 glycosylhydrolase [Fibrobacter sp.]|nr:family 43 glycosylhydrolase [Fibrobacter sp.]
MKQIALLTVFGLGFAAPVLADNPLSSYHYLADPAAFATDDEFYILTDTDDESPNTGENDYTIRSLYILSSKDMKNWTDHGMVLSHDREVSYIKNIWAPGIAVVDGVFYLIYPNGASGVGIVSSKNVAGPYHDPVGKLLVGGGGVTGCDGISWCFDPAIFIDEDGKSYMTFGGGSGGSRGYGNNFDLFEFSKLSYDKVELNVGSKTALQGANRSFEASYLHKRNGIYYLSYNDQSQNISYATSKNIKGPYSYVGTVIENPSKINGKGGNNHHGFAKFKDKWYAVYHDRRLVMASEKPKLTNGQTPTTTGNHRSVSIDELTWNGDKMNVVKFTDAGPAQVGKFDPYQTYKALTSSKQRNVRSRTDYTRGQAVVHVLTPLATKESWIRVSGVDFGKGAENLRIKAANVGDGNKVEIHKGSVSGTLAGTCELAKTDGWKSYTDNDCAMTGLSGVVDELFFVFKGSRDSTMGILEWEFQGTKREPEPQTPYGDKAAAIPGKIEAEIFDKPGYGAGNDSYSDNDADNQGDAEFRAEDGVDIVLGGSGMAIGYTNAGEWMEYTVDVAEDGDYPIVANASSGAENSGFCFSVDGKPMGDTVKVTKTGDDWSVYKEFEAGTAKLTKGKHIIRLMITGNNVNIDWFSVGKAEKQDGPGTDGIAPRMKFDVNSVTSYRVFNVAGKQVGTVNLRGKTPATALAEAGFTQGVYMLKSFDGRKKFMVSSAR